MTTRKRKIFINNLILIASIGVYEKEKKVKQKIIVNLEILLTNDTEPQSDNLQQTQDYSQFRKCVVDVVDSKHFDLLESLTKKIHITISQNKFVLGVKVNISKPDIFDNCEVAYELSSI
ncbi:dihydroneopterin aldolase [Alphaproteobacteria bacterium]|nr:dihydroneopterin aldolase [Alphaproteobacteria bacterium]